MSDSIAAQLEQCYIDTKAVLGKRTAEFLADHGMERTTETARIAFIKTAVRNGDPHMARKLQARGGLSLEQIVLDHPDYFSPDDVEIARGNLGIQSMPNEPVSSNEPRIQSRQQRGVTSRGVTSRWIALAVAMIIVIGAAVLVLNHYG